MILTLWIGLVLGVSFYSAPIKFLAKGLTKGQLLNIGKISFQYFNYIEFVVLFISAVFLSNLLYRKEFKRPGFILGLNLLLLSILLIDSFYLLPKLNSYINTYASSTMNNIVPVFFHKLYIIGDLSKLIICFILVTISFKDSKKKKILALGSE